MPVRALVQFAGLHPWRQLPFLTSASSAPRGARATALGRFGRTIGAWRPGVLRSAATPRQQRVGYLVAIPEAQCRIRRQHGAVLLEDERRAEGHKLVPDVGYLCPGLDGPHLRNVGAGIGMLMIPCAPHLFFWISRFEHKTSAPAV